MTVSPAALRGDAFALVFLVCHFSFPIVLPVFQSHFIPYILSLLPSPSPASIVALSDGATHLLFEPRFLVSNSFLAVFSPGFNICIYELCIFSGLVPNALGSDIYQAIRDTQGETIHPASLTQMHEVPLCIYVHRR